jgi:hypothetical protein
MRRKSWCFLQELVAAFSCTFRAINTTVLALKFNVKLMIRFKNGLCCHNFVCVWAYGSVCTSVSKNCIFYYRAFLSSETNWFKYIVTGRNCRKVWQFLRCTRKICLVTSPFDVPEGQELYANEGQNYSEYWLDFLQELLETLTGWQFSFPKLCADLCEKPVLQILPQKIIINESKVRLVVMKVLPQIA